MSVLNKNLLKLFTILSVLSIICLNQINAENLNNNQTVEKSSEIPKKIPALTLTQSQKAVLLIIFIVIIIMSSIAIFVNCYIQMKNEKSDEKVRFSEIHISSDSDIHM